MRRTAVAFVSCLVVLGWTDGARATPTARLIYGRGRGAEACPDEATLRGAVSSRIGYDPFFPYASRTVVLTISGDDGRLLARVELVENGEVTARELTSDSACADLVESAALAIAIAIDPRALIAPVSHSDSEAPEPPPRRSADTAPPLAEAPHPEDRAVTAPRASSTMERPRARLMIGPRLATGLQPGAAVGLGLGGSVLWDRVSIGAELESYLPSTAGAASGARVRGWLFDGALVPCVRRVPFDLCGVARLGRFEGVGEHVRNSTSDAVVFLGLGMRAGLELAISESVRVHVAGDLVGNLARPTLKVGPETIWQAPVIAGVIAGSTSYEF